MWKTSKWVPEWVIRRAIAHLHELSILAGVHCTGAIPLNKKPPHNEGQQVERKPRLSTSRCALSHP